MEDIKYTSNDVIHDIECLITPENEKTLIAAIQAIKYKDFFDGLKGKGLMIANWHLNGDLEALDRFIESAEQEGRGVAEKIEEDIYSPLGNEEYVLDITGIKREAENAAELSPVLPIYDNEQGSETAIKAAMLYRFFAGLLCNSESAVFRVYIQYIKKDILKDNTPCSANIVYYHNNIKPLLEFINERSRISVFDTKMIIHNGNTYIDFCILRKRGND